MQKLHVAKRMICLMILFLLTFDRTGQWLKFFL